MAANETEPLPPLSDHQFKMYNVLAERMNAFHNHFRQSWNLLWQACTTGRRPHSMTLKQFIEAGLKFAAGLTMHHQIEETRFFPRLAGRMPEFSPENGDLVKQHAQIHAGLVEFERYLKRCKSGEADFDMRALKEKMESWGSVLWMHLDEEVKSLGAENMRKYWTLKEIQRLWM